MTILSTAELYAIFLDSDWWRDLSYCKRNLVGCCEKCGTPEDLESHHLFYRENWFDTRMSDLRVLCRDCHQSEHDKRKQNTRRKPNRRKKHRQHYGSKNYPKMTRKQLKLARWLADKNRVDKLRIL